MPTSREIFDNLALQLEDTITKEQSRIQRIYAEAYKEIIDRIRKIYDKYADGNGEVSNMDKTEVNRLRSIGEQCSRRLSLAHNDVQKLLEKDCATVYGESFFRNAWAVDTNLAPYGISGNWGLIPAEAADRAALDGYSMLAQSQTFNRAQNRAVNTIQGIFSKGIIEGHSYERVRDLLIKAIGVSKVSANAVRYNGTGVGAWAMMVTRTEMHRAFSLAQAGIEDRCKAQGLELEWVWLATLDGRTRPAHGNLDGQYKDEDNGGWYVPELGTYVRGPGLSGVAAFDINCRCTVMAVHPEEGLPEGRYERGRENQKWKTYSQWKRERLVNVDDALKLKVKPENGRQALTRDEILAHLAQIVDHPEQTEIPEGKINRFFLDPNSTKPDRWAFLHDRLGYNREDGEILKEHLRQMLAHPDAIRLKKLDKWGDTYNIYGMLPDKTGATVHHFKVGLQFSINEKTGQKATTARLVTGFSYQKEELE